MSKYHKFIFGKYEWLEKEGKIHFHYRLENDQPTETIYFTETISYTEKITSLADKSTIDQALKTAHIACGISYYKTYLPKIIILENYKLTPEQAKFWHTFYTKSLGEFFFKNKIDFRGLISFPSEVKIAPSPSATVLPESATILIGGGKDSLVSIELLKKSALNLTLFSLRNPPIIKSTAQKTGLVHQHWTRNIDPQLLKLNEAGAYNGHIGATGIISFISVVFALLNNQKYLILSNEDSANFGNLTYLGAEMNHQWTKSWEAEQLISSYINKYINSNITYFSYLRNLSELKIVKIFTSHSEFHLYYPIFASCNSNFYIFKKTTKKWCGECEKCAFIFLLFAAFLSLEELIEIFGYNLFTNKDLVPVYQQLLGVGSKPWECVGTPEESRVAMYLTYAKNPQTLAEIQDFFEGKILPQITNPKQLLTTTLRNRSTHNIPVQLLKYQHL